MSKVAIATALLTLLVAAPAGAATFTFDDPNGLDDGLACLSSEANCDLLTKDFTISSFGAVTGTITWVGGLVDIDITMASASFNGGFDGVEEIVFTNVTYDVSGWVAADLGGTITGFGSPTGSVSGTYEQFAPGGVSVAGPTAFALPVQFSNLLCTNTAPSGVCGFSVGTLRDFELLVGAVTPQNHDFTHTFNLATPEPSSALLLGSGLFALAARRRRR